MTKKPARSSEAGFFIAGARAGSVVASMNEGERW
jgi:hypothetical protein